MVTTVSISGDIGLQDGTEPTGRTIIFTLSNHDFDETEIVEPKKQIIQLNTSGQFANAPLWPNARGTRGTTYKVEVAGANGAAPKVLADKLWIPESATPLDLVAMLQVAEAVKPTAAKVIYFTQAQYEAALASGTLVEGALYLVGGGA